MAQEEKVTAPSQDETKYQSFDVGPQGGKPHDKPTKRSPLLTVCPFILGEDCAVVFSSITQCFLTGRFTACIPCMLLCLANRRIPVYYDLPY